MERAGNQRPDSPVPPATDSGATGNAIYGARREPTPRSPFSPSRRFGRVRQRHLWSASRTNASILPLADSAAAESTGARDFIYFFFLILDFPVHFKLTSFSNLKFKANSKLELRPSGTVPISSASINLIAVQSTRCLIFAVQSITMAVNGLELDETSLRLASRS